MFRINYRIITKDKELSNATISDTEDGGFVEGFIELAINSKKYGYCSYNSLHSMIEIGELLTVWFEEFLEILFMLNNDNNYVAMKVIDVPADWIEFRRLDDTTISISILRSYAINHSALIITAPPLDSCYGDWAHEKISLLEMAQEILIKIHYYLWEIEEINPKILEAGRLEKLRILLDSVKNFYRLQR